MRKLFLSIIICFLLADSKAFCEKDIKKPEETYHISEEDMEIIKHMEILELMEIAEELQLLQEMDILIEDENYAKKN